MAPKLKKNEEIGKKSDVKLGIKKNKINAKNGDLSDSDESKVSES